MSQVKIFELMHGLQRVARIAQLAHRRHRAKLIYSLHHFAAAIFEAGVSGYVLVIAGMSIWNAKLWMVERRSLIAHTLIGQRQQEGHKPVLLSLAQVKRLVVGTKIMKFDLAEVPASIVELHHVPQSEQPAVVPVRSG